MNSQDVILGTLMNQSLSGYDIKHKFETLFTFFFDASYGTIYPTLNKLEKEGFITKESVVQEGKPNKNVYTITERGKEQFAKYMASPLENDTVKSDFLMRLFFGEYAEAGKLKEWLEYAKETVERRMGELKVMQDQFEPHMSFSQKVCLRMGIADHEARMAVIEEGLKALEERE